MKKVFLIITGLLFTLLLTVSTGVQARVQKNNISYNPVATGSTAETENFSFSIAHHSADGEIEFSSPATYHATQSANERKIQQILLFIIASFITGRLFLLKFIREWYTHYRPLYLQLIFPFHFFW